MNNLKMTREKLGLTQGELAQALRVTQAAVCRIETGTLQMSHKLKTRFEAAMKNGLARKGQRKKQRIANALLGEVKNLLANE